MMRRFAFLVCIFISNFVIGQITEEIPVYIIVEEMPNFPGGDQKLLNYISANLKYPSTAVESGISGIVYVTFVVMETGEVADVKVLRGIGGGCDEEAIRIIKSMPRWKAGMQNGNPVRVQYNLPVTFTIPKVKLAPPLSAQEKYQQKKNKRSRYSRILPGITIDFQTLKHQSINVGLGIADVYSQDVAAVFKGLIFQNEFIFQNDRKDFIYSPQVSVFFSPMAFYFALYGSIKLSYYTNFKDGGNFITAPEVGIGFFGVFLTYSRNISIIDNNLIPVNRNNLSLKALIPLKK